MGLLDTIAGASAAYSLRKIRDAYIGNCLKVRRSSDNTTLDIGFVDGWLDESSLLTFCGAGSGYVDTWYDQSTNAKNLTQATTGLQPRIVNAGVVETVTGTDGTTIRPAIRSGFSGASAMTATLSLSLTQSTFATVTKRVGALAGGTYGVLGILSTNYTSAGNYLMFVSEFEGGVSLFPQTLATAPTIRTLDLVSYHACFNSTVTLVRANGFAFTNATRSALTVDGTTLSLFAWNGNASNQLTSEFILWPTDLDAESDVTVIDHSDAFGIVVPRPPTGGVAAVHPLGGA